jgi:CBS domain-containing protein
MLEAEKIMGKNVVSVTPDTSIFVAMHMLIEKEISGLPVVDGANHVVGVVTENDMLNLLLNTSLSEKDVVRNFMTESVVTFDAKDSIIDICEFFIKNHICRVPILKDGKLVGIISRRDLIMAILKTRGNI